MTKKNMQIPDENEKANAADAAPATAEPALTKQQIDDAQKAALAQALAGAPGKAKAAAQKEKAPGAPQNGVSGGNGGEDEYAQTRKVSEKPKTKLTRDQMLAQIREESLARVDYDRFNDDIEDRFFVPPEYIPDGFTVEWKNSHINGMAVDPAYNLSLEQAGWRPVTTELMPQIVPAGYGLTYIERDGMVLMIRPSEITEYARAADFRRAREQMKSKMDQLKETPSGQMDRELGGIRREMIATPKRLQVEE